MKKESLREAYAMSLLSLFKKDRRIVVLDSDVSRSTRTGYCQEEDPSRYFEMGIAEQDMMGFAAGLALSGHRPFAHSFAVFCAGRGYDVIRQLICIPGLNVKIVGSNPGLSDTTDGATHQMVEDLALMRALPNMRVYAPSDAVETRLLFDEMAKFDGPSYMRLCRQDLPVLTDEESYKPGKVQRHRDGTEICVIANGSLIEKALAAAEELSIAGISTKVLSIGTIKPLDVEGLLDETKGMKGVVVAEEHSVIGGLGSAVAAAFAINRPTRMEFIGIKDVFGTMSYNYEELLEHFGLTAAAIREAAARLASEAVPSGG